MHTISRLLYNFALSKFFIKNSSTHPNKNNKKIMKNLCVCLLDYNINKNGVVSLLIRTRRTDQVPRIPGLHRCVPHQTLGIIQGGGQGQSNIDFVGQQDEGRILCHIVEQLQRRNSHLL